MRGVAGLALGVMLAGCVTTGCGGARPIPGFDKRNEISNLWTQIRGWRHEAKMDLDPSTQLMQILRAKTVGDAKMVCKADQTEAPACSDICSIADAICDNAERICDLAEDLGKHDSFGQEKCTSAKASCQEAKQRCCGCSDTNTPTGSSGAGGHSSLQGSQW